MSLQKDKIPKISTYKGLENAKIVMTIISKFGLRSILQVKREIIANIGVSHREECVIQSHRCESWHGV